MPALCVAILLLSASVCCAEPLHTTDSRTVTFSIDRPDLWFEGRFPVSATWADSFTASKDEVLSIPYTLAPQAADVEVTVPLSDYLGWLGIDDVTIDVPLGNTPLGLISMSLTQAAGLPSWAASLDFVLRGSVEMHELCCTTGSVLIQTSASTMTWNTWSTKTAQVVAPESPGGSVRAILAYTVSGALTLSVLGIDVYEIIPSQTLASSVASTSLETEIDVPEPPNTLSTMLLAASIAAVVVVAVVALLLLLRKKRGGPAITTAPEETAPQQPQEGVSAPE